MSASPARRLAREVVSRVRDRDAYAHEVLASALASSHLSAADRAFATRLAYGVVQTRGTLDEALARHTRLNRLEPRIADALALSAYELLFAATPARAAVAEGVELVRSLRSQAAGLANAVLRRLAEEAETFPWGDPATDDAALARLHGHPLWLARLWIAELGRETAAAVMAADNEPAPLFLAENPFAAPALDVLAALEADGADPAATSLSGSWEARDAAAAVRGATVASGHVLVCDLGAQFVARLAAPSPGSTLVEIGSGRGTKTLLMQAEAVAQGGPADIRAIDIHPFKAHLLRERMDALGVPGVTAVVADATDLSGVAGLPAPASVDGVLIDAPCSGLGTLRRHPEKRWRVTPDDIAALGSLDSAILAEASRLVRPGGFVVYSTCTITERENRAVVEGFLGSAEGASFSSEPIADAVPAPWHDALTPEGWLQLTPTPGGPDGHFVARLRRA